MNAGLQSEWAVTICLDHCTVQRRTLAENVSFVFHFGGWYDEKTNAVCSTHTNSEIAQDDGDKKKKTASSTTSFVPKFFRPENIFWEI
jgi:hypothetical protein